MIPWEDLLAYWLGELSPEREAEVEERLFSDGRTARRLESIAALDASLTALAQRGAVTGAVTADALDRLAAAGVVVRQYRIVPGQTVPCTVANEDFVAIRLAGGFAGEDTVNIDLDARLEGEAPTARHTEGVPVDRRTGEVVLLYPGDRIRALPRSQFTYRVSAGSRTLGDFHLDHTPPS